MTLQTYRTVKSRNSAILKCAEQNICMLIIQQAEVKMILLAQPSFRTAVYRSGVQVAESLILRPLVSGPSSYTPQPESSLVSSADPHGSPLLGRMAWAAQPSPALLQKLRRQGRKIQGNI